MLSKYGNKTKHTENRLFLQIKSGRIKIYCRYFVGVFNKKIILLAFVGYEMIIGNLYPTRLVGYHPPSHIQRALGE